MPASKIRASGPGSVLAVETVWYSEFSSAPRQNSVSNAFVADCAARIANHFRKMMVHEVSEIRTSSTITACTSRLALVISDRIERSFEFIVVLQSVRSSGSGPHSAGRRPGMSCGPISPSGRPAGLPLRRSTQAMRIEPVASSVRPSGVNAR